MFAWLLRRIVSRFGGTTAQTAPHRLSAVACDPGPRPAVACRYTRPAVACDPE